MTTWKSLSLASALAAVAAAFGAPAAAQGGGAVQYGAPHPYVAYDEGQYGTRYYVDRYARAPTPYDAPNPTRYGRFATQDEYQSYLGSLGFAPAQPTAPMDRDYAAWRAEQARLMDEYYGRWRAEQLARMDRNYAAWRAEQIARLSPEFGPDHSEPTMPGFEYGDWRANRMARTGEWPVDADLPPELSQQ